MADQFLILGRVYKVLTCPDLLADGRKALIDHRERVIWLAPGLSPSEGADVQRRALRQAQRDAATAMPTVQ